MTNKNIALRIKALLSQNKHLRQELEELKKQGNIINELMRQEQLLCREVFLINKMTIEKQREELRRVRHQRNYYNRMVYDLHRKIKILEENNDNI